MSPEKSKSFHQSPGWKGIITSLLLKPDPWALTELSERQGNRSCSQEERKGRWDRGFDLPLQDTKEKFLDFIFKGPEDEL